MSQRQTKRQRPRISPDPSATPSDSPNALNCENRTLHDSPGRYCGAWRAEGCSQETVSVGPDSPL
jgi:hypothetical protein